MLRHKEPYLSFYRILGYCPHRIELYQQAVTHRSAVASDENGRKINNERLEFLGDAVFTLVTADILYHAVLVFFFFLNGIFLMGFVV